MTFNVAEVIEIILLGGLFGWLLSKFPDRWVYVVMALSIILGVVVMKVR